MREKQLHATIKHGRSFLTGETVTFVESTNGPSSLVASGSITERNATIRRMLEWPTNQRTIYPSTERCEALNGEET